MASLSLHLSTVLLITVIFATLLNPIESSKPKNRANHSLFVFGDSVFDSGNNQYWNGSKPNPAGRLPYGETFFKHPSGRISDGRIVPDFIALFAKLPFIPPYLKPGEHDFTIGANIASAGAGVLYSTHPKIAINLHTQLSYFKEVELRLKQKLGDVEAKKLLRKAVYMFSMGSNDYFSFFQFTPNATASSQRDYVEIVIGNFTNVIKEIYAMGGRKMAFQNVGPLGCTPYIKFMAGAGDECTPLPMELARRHNRELSNALKKLESQLPGFKYSIFDFYNSLYDRIKTPSKYGFKEAKEACCGIGPYRAVGCGVVNGTTKYELCSNPSEYVFFDLAHPTERIYWQMAKLFWNGSPMVTGPYNLKQLFTLP